MNHLLEFIINHWTLVGLLLVTGGLILWQENRGRGYAQLSPQEAIQLINHKTTMILDLREPQDFKKGHIVDARSFQPSEFNQPKVQKWKDKTMILVCRQGLVAQELADRWKKEGFDDVHVLSGGMDAWYAEGFPVVK